MFKLKMKKIRRLMRKPICRHIIETYMDFAENTSIHGIKYTVRKENNTYEKIAWVFIVLMGIVGSIFMIGLFWERYTSNPTRTSVGTTYAPTTTIPFPAITICNINKILDRKIASFVKKLELHGHDEEFVAAVLPQLLAFTDKGDFNKSDLQMVNDLFDANEINNMRRIMRQISQSCREMLVKCKWESKVIDCRKYFVDSLTTSGYCCSFNYDLKSKEENTTLFFGFEMGLTILLNPMLEKTQYAALSSRGMKVIIHHPHNYPGFGNTEKILAVGRETLLQIDGTRYICSSDVRQLTPQQRKCVYSDEYNLNYFSEYTQPNCIMECLANYISNSCDCLPYYYSFADKPVCNATKIPCLAELRDKRKESLYQRSRCDCPTQCEDIFYNVLSTSTKFFQTEYLTSSFLYDVKATESSMLLHVYFRSQTQTILLRDTLTSSIYLLSSFGGIFSLFLGCSFISGVEIIYYISIRFFVRSKLLNANVIRKYDSRHETYFNKQQQQTKFRPISHVYHGNFKNAPIYSIYDRNVFLN